MKRIEEILREIEIKRVEDRIKSCLSNTVAASNKELWEIVPEPGACDKCLERSSRKYDEQPEKTHPNCKCEIKIKNKISIIL